MTDQTKTTDYATMTSIQLLERISALEDALRDIRAGILKHAEDTVWFSEIETVVDFINATLGGTFMNSKQPETTERYIVPADPKDIDPNPEPGYEGLDWTAEQKPTTICPSCGGKGYHSGDPEGEPVPAALGCRKCNETGRVRVAEQTPTTKSVGPRPVTPELLDEFVKWTHTASMFTNSPEGAAFGFELRDVIRLAKEGMKSS